MSLVSLYDEVDLRESAKAEAPVFSRSQLIEEILEVNRTVAPAFLEGFSERRLRAYRDHLVWAQEPREKASPWGDPDGTPAIGYVDSED